GRRKVANKRKDMRRGKSCAIVDLDMSRAFRAGGNNISLAVVVYVRDGHRGIIVSKGMKSRIDKFEAANAAAVFEGDQPAKKRKCGIAGIAANNNIGIRLG